MIYSGFSTFVHVEVTQLRDKKREDELSDNSNEAFPRFLASILPIYRLDVALLKMGERPPFC